MLAKDKEKISFFSIINCLSFSENERKMIINLNQTYPISLAKNILKAETAALSANTIVNYHLNLS